MEVKIICANSVLMELIDILVFSGDETGDINMKNIQPFTFGADSISKEVAGFSPFMVPLRKNTVFIVSCV